MIITYQELQMVQVALGDPVVLVVLVVPPLPVAQEWKPQANLDLPSVLSPQVSQVGQEVQQR